MPVIGNRGANIWPCQPENSEPSQWWCGDVGVTPICHSGNQAYIHDYTSGSILGFPPTTSSPSAATQSSCKLATTTFYVPAYSPTKMCSDPSLPVQTQRRSTNLPTALSPAKISTASSLPVQTQTWSTNLPTNPPAPAASQKHSASLSTAIGFGVGIPLGIAAIGFLSFLFWKVAGWQRKSKRGTLSQEHALGHGHQSTNAVINRMWTELPDAQLPIELDDTSRREPPST